MSPGVDLPAFVVGPSIAGSGCQHGCQADFGRVPAWRQRDFTPTGASRRVPEAAVKVLGAHVRLARVRRGVNKCQIFSWSFGGAALRLARSGKDFVHRTGEAGGGGLPTYR